jgi:hypothetical protein
MQTTRKISQKGGILVVRMRADHHDASRRIEPFQRLPDRDLARNVPLGLSGTK